MRSWLKFPADLPLPRASFRLTVVACLVAISFGGCATAPDQDAALQWSFNGSGFAPAVDSAEAASWTENGDVASGPIEQEWAQRTYTLRSRHADAQM